MSYLNFDLVEGLSVVHTNLASNHLGDDDHVTQMSLDNIGLLTSGSLFLLYNYQIITSLILFIVHNKYQIMRACVNNNLQ